jgi:hypothetical protein
MTGFTNLIIEQTPKTPQIDLNKFTGDLIFSGRSTPENAASIFEPVIHWTECYIKAARPVTNLRLNLEYFNSTTALWLAKLLKLLFSIEDPEHVLFIDLYLPVDEYNSIKEFDDLRNSFLLISDFHVENVHNLGIKLYARDNNNYITAEKLILADAEQCVHVPVG